MMGRPLISKTIAALVVVATCLVQQCRCSRMLSFYNQYRAGLQGISQECAPRRKRKQNVVVNTVELVCDSDENNDYYSYTNSLTCRTGDIAKVAVGFRLRNMANYTIGISIHASMYGKQKTIWEPSNICMFRDLDYIGNGDDDSMRGSGCPLIEGAYELFTSFTVPKFSRDTDIKFTPSLHIEFYDFVKDSQPLIGCVESGTLGQIAREKREAAQGQSLLIMFTVLFVVGFAGCLLGHRRSCKRSERVETNRKNAMIRRFHYRRSVQNGAGLPLRPEMEETELSSFGSGMVREIS